ncbi:hypothetical protein WOLCODRAFT_166925 [Wolfiporia cocos MD-104 SS10]|uniref:Fungal-type protein kinase domain-containing protein n=1 Tax=Wolfiporia cocos (strain MD-104) TaxID=742152 RepID=A0A2H3JCI3_WOLCO|nr:hypothetical protein WOLCODRAFT_166925 [Wolfiporia cocos MD-104 SS10]
MLKCRLVFLKDSWRSEKAHAEHDIYLHLWKHDVHHIATPLSGGDVCDDSVQTTRSQECNAGLQKRIHYRLIILEVGQPLKDYEEAVYLVKFLQQAVEAHGEAWTKAGILHRDVSVDNIVFDPDPPKDDEGNKIHRAFLIYWDLCKYRKELESGPTQATRSGTWQFMSAALLRYPSKRHDVSDDLESFIHIIYWLALRFHDHDLNSVQLESRIHNTFDERWDDNGRDIGGTYKLDLMKSGSPPYNLIDDPAFNWLLEGLADMCQDQYRAAAPELSAFDAAELQRKIG